MPAGPWHGRLYDLADLRSRAGIKGRKRLDLVTAAQGVLEHQVIVGQPNGVLGGVFQGEAALHLALAFRNTCLRLW